MHRNCTHQHSDYRSHSHVLSHVLSHGETSWRHLFDLTLERVNAVLSAELLEILRDGVCGGEKLGFCETSSESKTQRGQTGSIYSCSLGYATRLGAGTAHCSHTSS